MATSKPLLRYDRQAYPIRVDSGGFGPKTKRLADFLMGRVIGQDRAALRVARSFAVYNAGLQDENKPIIAALFSGPTGVGKTFMAEELARYLIEDVPNAPLYRIQCGEYTEKHRVSQLIGSPPGYIGSDEVPGLAQQKIDQAHFWIKYRQFVKGRFKDTPEPDDMQKFVTEAYQKLGPYISVILFDEIEKAHPELWNLLLHILDDGQLRLSDGSTTSFRNSVILLTSNVGGKRSQQILSGKKSGMGFGGAEEAVVGSVDERIYRETYREIEKIFPPEFVGRLRNEIVVFRSLEREHCRKVLDLMLAEVLKKTNGSLGAKSIPLEVRFTDQFKEYLLDEGIDALYGLRPLKKTVYKLVTVELSNAIEAGEVKAGDNVLFVYEDGAASMYRSARPGPMEDDAAAEEAVKKRK